MLGLAAVFGSSCSRRSQPTAQSTLPDPSAARRALEQSLDAWRESPQLERTVSTVRPVMFVDLQRQPGQRLRQFTILGETASLSGYRRFLVKLTLEQPDDSLVASYYVFGRGPIWVYRAEDFDMIMHMDKSMMAEPTPPDGQVGPSNAPKPESTLQDQGASEGSDHGERKSQRSP
jgi:hypothetical protein